MRLAIPDLISNSYFPALAAAELGFFEREGIAVEAELIFPVDRAYEALREGEIDFVGGAAHGALAAFPGWRGRPLARRAGAGDVLVPGDARRPRHRPRRSGRAQGPADRRGSLGRDGTAPAAGRRRPRSPNDHIEIAPVPGASGSSVNFGLTAAEALAAGKIDGFWANGMATEIAVTTGVGTHRPRCAPRRRAAGLFRLHDAGPGDDRALIEHSPETAAAAVRALVATQEALKHDVARATEVGATLSAARGGADRRDRAPRSAVLRRCDQPRLQSPRSTRSPV